MRRRSILWEESLAETLSCALVQDARRLRQATNTGVWLAMQPLTVNRTELGVQEWQDALFLQYRLDPPDLPKFCNGCNAALSICHSLNCSRGGLVATCNNELCGRVVDLSRKSFNPTHVRTYPPIFAGCAVKRTTTNPASYKTTTSTNKLEATEQKGDSLIHDVWKNGTDSSHDIHVVNTDNKSHSTKTPENFIQEAERMKNKMYLETCLQQRQHFSPFVTSVAGLLGVEAGATLKSISICLRKKCQ